jgi:hypothetical protein
VYALGFDPGDGQLSGFESQVGTGLGMATSGFSGESVSKTFNGTNAMGPIVRASFLGADAARNLFVQVAVQANPGAPIDFGLGTVGTGTYLLHYDPSGTLVSDSLPTGVSAVGALGDLFYAAQIAGTTDQGCGTVGTAGVTSTVLTERDATGTCIWSKALPASTLFALDPSQDVVVATTFSGSVDFGGGALTSVGTTDLAIAKLDPSGNLLWSKSFGASGATLGGISALGATNSGGVAISAGIGGAVDFGCGAVTSSSGATTLIANFDATGSVVYSWIVQLAGGGSAVADGLGGISIATQPLVSACACTSAIDCPPVSIGFPQCTNGMCNPCNYGSFPQYPGDVLISRFAP